MDLIEYRERIDRVDRELVRLFTERMRISADVAAWKKASGMPVYDPAREQQKLRSVGDMAAQQAGEEMRAYTEQLFSTLMSLSKDYQRSLNESEAEK